MARNKRKQFLRIGKILTLNYKFWKLIHTPLDECLCWSAEKSTLRQLYRSLEPPRPSPKVPFDDPGFENLTNAEKLNERGYRDSVYQKYSNEPTCACLVKHGRKGNPCRSGCAGPACSRLKSRDNYSGQNDFVNNVPVTGRDKDLWESCADDNRHFSNEMTGHYGDSRNIIDRFFFHIAASLT